MKTLLLVDGSSYLYRAFHALPELRSRGRADRRDLRRAQHAAQACSNDYRRIIAPACSTPRARPSATRCIREYKATRTADARRPRGAGRAAARGGRGAWAGRCCVVDGVEADDVIATLASRRSAGCATVISTGDKDLTQLVDDQRHAGQHHVEREARHRAGVKSKFGVPPEQIIDYLTLIGDSDRQHSRRRQGRARRPRARWIEQYGSLEG